MDSSYIMESFDDGQNSLIEATHLRWKKVLVVSRAIATDDLATDVSAPGDLCASPENGVCDDGSFGDRGRGAYNHFRAYVGLC